MPSSSQLHSFLKHNKILRVALPPPSFFTRPAARTLVRAAHSFACAKQKLYLAFRNAPRQNAKSCDTVCIHNNWLSAHFVIRNLFDSTETVFRLLPAMHLILFSSVCDLAHLVSSVKWMQASIVRCNFSCAFSFHSLCIYLCFFPLLSFLFLSLFLK